MKETSLKKTRKILKRPVFAAALMYCAGLLCGYYIGGAAAFVFCAAVPALFLVLDMYREGAAALFALLGAALVTAAVYPRFAGVTGDAELIVNVAEADRSARGWSVTAVIESGTVGGLKAPNASVSMFSELSVAPGDIMRVSGTLRDPLGQRNPGGMDERLWLLQKGVHKVLDADEYAVTGRSTGLAYAIPRFFHDMRLAAADNIDRAAGRHSGILRAMALGDTSAVTDDLSRIYKDMGIYHAIAISGMQVTLVAMVLKRLFGFILGGRAASIVSLAAVTAYCVFTGAGPSMVRAVIMFASLTVGEFLLRDRDGLSSVSLAALVMLIMNPMYLWDLGFQLSFAAVAGLIVLTPKIEGLIKPLSRRNENRYIKPFVRHIPPSIAATLAVSPILAGYYGTVQPIGLLSNILIAPTAAIPVAGSVLAALFGGMGAFGQAIGGASGAVLEGYEVIGRASAAIPFSAVVTGSPPVVFTAAFYILLLVFALSPEDRKRRLYLCALGAALCVSGCQLYSGPGGDLRVTMLDVGQGDCTVIEYGSACAVIDGGGKPLVGLGGNTGDKVLAPFLRFRGHSSVGHAFVSHMDDDHVLGVIELMRQMPVDNVYIPAGSDRGGELFFFLEAAAKQSGTAIHETKAGNSVILGGELRFDCLYPADADGTVYPAEGDGTADSNENCLALRLSFREASFLFCGDLGFAQEDRMLASFPAGFSGSASLLDCDALKLSHHGSRYSNSPAFVSAVSPSLCFAGAGIGNGYGHPSQIVRDMLGEMGVPLFCTADMGAVEMVSDGGRIWVNGG